MSSSGGLHTPLRGFSRSDLHSEKFLERLAAFSRKVLGKVSLGTEHAVAKESYSLRALALSELVVSWDLSEKSILDLKLLNFV